ncbi:MAG: hypothetical protein ACI9JN_001133 [Bacteroidia bacterium]|jgi:hypothetical protein
MKTNLRILTIGLICLIIGGAIGFFTAGRITKKRIHNKVEMQKPPKFKQRLEEKLDLTAAQQVKFNSVFMEHMNRMQTINKGMFEKRATEFELLFSDLKVGLDTDQIQKVKKFEKRFKNRKHRPNPPHSPRDRE